MFREIGIATGHCDFCGDYGTVALLAVTKPKAFEHVQGCERCWRATGRAADLLRVVRLGKAPKAKHTPKASRSRRRSDPKPAAGHPSGVEHEGGTTVPLAASGLS